MHVIPMLDTGGAQAMCESLVSALKTLNNEVIVACLYSCSTPITRRINEKGIKIFFLNKKRGFDVTCIYRLKKIIDLEKPEVIHTHLYVTKYVALANWRYKIPVVHTIHSVAEKENTKLGILFNRLLFKNNKIQPVALSQNIRESISKVYRINQNRIPIVYNGIDLKRFEINNKNVDKDEFVIIHVGRFADVKNQMLLVQAFEQILNKHKCKLWLIGDGEDYFKVQSYIERRPCKDSIVLWGNQSNPETFLAKASLFVLPSKYEGIPMSIAEAMASGLPIIASNVGGIRDMITHGVNGILITPNLAELIEAIDEIITNKDLRERLAIKSKESSKKFSNINMANGYLNIYRDIVNHV